MSQLPSAQELLAALQQSTKVIQSLESRLNRYQEPIAIIGIGCRFPGRPGAPAHTPEEYWANLRNGCDAVSEVIGERWPIEEYYDPDPAKAGKTYTRYGAFIDQVDQFDPRFFGLSPRETIKLDPQHRLLLETAWEAIERAGIAADRLRNTPVGVFVGLWTGEYGKPLISAMDDFYSIIGNVTSTAAGRLSYLMGLTGPALAVDTACSASLVSIHLACQSLRHGECKMALAGGVNLILAPEVTALFCRGSLLAADGRCKTFDAAANGYVRGEGCGMILLKPLADALADNDPIIAVIRGTAINQDGPSSGLTVPNGPSQEGVIRQALKNARVKPEEVSYIEAHGTGTALGDPIEIGALNAVFQERTTPLHVGSVKTNFGHLEFAAGIASVIKVALALQHGEIPKHLHFERPNPLIDWEHSPIHIPTETMPWAVPAGKKRLAGVSSFGFSGTNAHIVLEEAPPPAAKPAAAATPGQPAGAAHLLTLSAKEETALLAMAQRYADFLAAPSATAPSAAELADICYTSQCGRNHYPHRLSVVAPTAAQMQQHLAAYAESAGQQLPPGLAYSYAPKGQKAKIAFLFTGQGAQYVNMGRELYANQPIFRRTIDRCHEVWQAVMGRSLLDLLYPTGEAANNDLMTSHPCGQAANFALECALVELWRAWGIEPAVVLGHSLGDFAAAYAAGVLSLEDGLCLVTERGRLMETAAGTMLSVIGSEAEVAPFLAGLPDVTIGVINGPRSVVISGSHTTVAHLTQQLQAAGFKTRKLEIPVAAHSPMLDPVLDAFEAAVRKITLAPPKLPVVSSMTGKLVTDELTDPRYWRQHLRNTVRFADGVQSVQALGCTLFLEIGPKPTLLGMASQVLDQVTSTKGISSNGTHPRTESPVHPFMLPSLREDRPAWQQIQESLGALYVHGVEVDWPGFYRATAGSGARRRVAVPTYPFQRQRYWDELFKPQRPATAPALRPLIHKMTKSPAIKETIFETAFSLDDFPFLADHVVYGAVVSPGACQLALLLSAAEVTFGAPQPLQVADVILPQALVIPPSGQRTVQAVLTPTAANGSGPKYDFQLLSFDAGAQQTGADVETATHATGYLALPPTACPAAANLAALRQRCRQAIDLAAHYQEATAMKLQLGPSFRWLAELWQGQGEHGYEALGKLYLPDAINNTSGYLLHPGLLDACFQVASVAQAADAPQGETWLPFAVAALRLYQPMAGEQWWCHVTQVSSRKWDIQLLDQQGQVVAAVDGYEVRAAAPEAVRTADLWREWLYEVAWQPRPTFGLAPDYLPTPATAVCPLRASAPALWAAHNGAEQERFLAALEALSIDYVLAAFTKVGFSFKPGAQWRTEQIAQKIGVIPHYRRLLARLLAMLAEVDILAATNDGWQVVQSPTPVNLTDKVAALQHTYGDTPELTLLTRCGEKLSEVLRGLQEPLDLLFPGGDTSVANRLYTAAPVAQVMNQLVQTVVQQSVQALPSDRGLRIIEIGAGTGGTTAGLLPLLPAAQSAYTFTDISPAFLTKAQERFAAYDFLHYAPLDIEQAPTSQDFARHQADLVIAANVLHATKDLAATLAHVRELLQPGGQLLLMEGTNRSRLIDLTFGLTDGWWRFADNRVDHPLLTAAQWQALLLANGFQAVETVDAGGQALIIAQAGPALTVGEPWLIFADDQGVGAALATTLQGRGATPFLIYAGTTYQQRAERSFTICPTSEADYQRLLATLRPHYATGYGVVHLWSLDTPALSAAEDLRTAIQPSYQSALLLTQSLLQQPVLPSSLWLVTQEAQGVTATDQVYGAAAAGLWGIGKVIALEHPELHCHCLDLAATPEPALLAARLGAELMAGSSQAAVEDQVALRLDGRYIARLQPYQVQPARPQPCPVTAAATYLITGGLGGLGLAVAQWLAEQGARHLLLLGRSQPNGAAQAQVAALTEMGVTVTVAQADVTDQAQLAAALQRIDERYPLRGVIHAVGVLDDGALVQQQWSRFERVLAPKMSGAWQLHTLTQAQPLDFFVLFSSAASLLGNRGQANHAAANAFLDAFVHYRRAQGLPALSINWGPWSEIGAAAELLRTQQQPLAAQGINAIAPKQGIAAFAYLLGQSHPQVGVVPLTWAKFLSTTKSTSAYYAAFVQATPAPVSTTVVQPVHLRQQLTTASGEERNRLLLHHLRTAIAKVLRLRTPEQLDPRQGIMEMGMDSLMAVELRNHLGRTLEHTLPSTLIFDYPTVELLHGYLATELFGAPTVQEAEETRLSAADSNLDDAAIDTLTDDEIAALLAQAVYSQ